MSQPVFRVAVVCRNNVNRSMEAHCMLQDKGFCVSSFGTGSDVRLPGPRPALPVVYDFSTTYGQMSEDLLRKDQKRYSKNGVLHILQRNERIKPRPERFQECKETFDVIFTCEKRVFHKVLKDLHSREQKTSQPVHVINVDIADTKKGASLGAVLICRLCHHLHQLDDLDSSLGQMLLDMEKKTGRVSFTRSATTKKQT